jgi:toxin HigB-1
MEIYDVELSPQAKRDLRKVPAFILDKFEGWVKAVEKEGLRQVQRIPGYHDERAPRHSNFLAGCSNPG